jgi:protease-4
MRSGHPIVARRIAAASSLAALLVFGPSARGSETPLFDVFGHESVAAADAATGFAVNPAAGGIRYPGELLLAWRRLENDVDGYLGAVHFGGFGLSGAHEEHGPSAVQVGLAGGENALRLGFTSTWRRGARGDRVTDFAVGSLARPSPWLSLGLRADHLAEPRFESVRLRREYAVGVGLRPLGLARPSAFAGGPRLTLTADVILREDDRRDQARARFGAEWEAVPGVVLRGAVERDGFRVGLGLLGVGAAVHGHGAWRDGGSRAATVGAVSFHDGEDRTVLALPGERRVARVRIAGALGDEVTAGFSLFGGGADTRVEPIHRRLDRALRDPLTRAVLLELDGASTMAQLEELRPRIARLRAAGKPVVAWLEEGGGRGDLYLAAACDRIVTSPAAAYVALGLRVERRYYRRLLADWGLTIDRSSYGRYKSAYRTFSVDSTPPADREAIEHNLDALQKLFVDAVVADRKLDRGRLLQVLDGRWWPPAELQKAGIVDSLGYHEDALRIVGAMSGLGDDPRVVDLADHPEARRAWRVPARIAVVYASGAIERGRSGHDLLNGATLGARTLIDQLEQAFSAPEYDAVVLRIESPGGSSLASDLIHHATVRLKRKHPKPFLVSMGATAASGGYHIAAQADHIFADRFTRTGSIGVVFVKPSLEPWYDEHRVRQDEFERGRFMRGSSLGRDWDARIQAHADSMVQDSYRRFVTEVADGRRLSWDAVHDVAQGRVWLGEDARSRRLVDEIGGLEDAIAEARRRAGVPEGEQIEIASFRRPDRGLIQRLVGGWAQSFWPYTVRLPEPGLYQWTELPEPP